MQQQQKSETREPITILKNILEAKRSDQGLGLEVETSRNRGLWNGDQCFEEQKFHKEGP